MNIFYSAHGYHASVVSFSNSFIKEYEKKNTQKLKFPIKRKYFVKKIIVNEAEKNVQKTTNEYFKLENKLKKL